MPADLARLAEEVTGTPVQPAASLNRGGRLRWLLPALCAASCLYFIVWLAGIVFGWWQLG